MKCNVIRFFSEFFYNLQSALLNFSLYNRNSRKKVAIANSLRANK
jgi:hypothetical protein